MQARFKQTDICSGRETIAKRIIELVYSMVTEPSAIKRKQMALDITAEIPDLEISAHDDGMSAARHMVISNYGRYRN